MSQKADRSYLEKRTRNNEAVKKSRQKSSTKAKETKEQIKKLKRENASIEGEITGLKKSCEQLKSLILAKDPNSSIAKINLEDLLKSDDEEEL